MIAASRILVLLFIAAPAWMGAQNAPPATDIYLAELREGEGGWLSVTEVVKLTDRAAYDNQPSILSDGAAILYTAFQPEDGQTDILRLDIAGKASRNLTQTPESEYSPTLTPDGEHFSVIRVESDGKQRLWKFPLQGGAPSLVLPDAEPVGYQAWASSDSVVLFILGDPPALQLFEVPSGKSRLIDRQVGRSLHRAGEDSLAYVRKASPDEWSIRLANLKSGQSSSICRTLEGSEDFAWTPSRSLLMGKGSKLYQRRVDDAGPLDWREVAELSGQGIRGITRLAVSPDGKRLALVSEH